MAFGLRSDWWCHFLFIHLKIQVPQKHKEKKADNFQDDEDGFEEHCYP